MKKVVFIGLIFFVLTMVFYGCSDKTTEPEIKRVATPEFNPPGGLYSSDLDVVIYSRTEDALIRYTIDGSEPTHTSSIYYQPIRISFLKDTTIKAKAYKSGYEDSEVATAIYLFSETPPGDGTINNPYQIASFGVLAWIAADSSSWDKHFIQVSDIDASETRNWADGGWVPIGNETTDFTGNYDGNGFIIDGLYINRPDTDYQGLFGFTYAATVNNLGIENVDITVGRFSGGLVGYNRWGSTITNSYSTGNVSGEGVVGGLVGYNCWGSTITNSYSTCSVSGNEYVGGLAGYIFSSKIINSYSTGSVSGEEVVGGLVGHNWGGSITSSYWDTQTSGKTESAGGEGRTTAEMTYPYAENTYVEWDFNKVWRPDEDHGFNNGYPYLR